MPISPFAAENLTAKYMLQIRRQVMEQANDTLRDELQQCEDFYIGGEATLQDKYFQKQMRETDEEYLARKRKPREVNICQRVVRAIADSVYGGEVQRHIRKRGAKDTSKREDARLDELMQLSGYDLCIRESCASASIYGTHLLGPFYHPVNRRVQFRTRHPSFVYPIQDPTEAQELLGLWVEYPATLPDGDAYTKAEAYSPTEIGFFYTEDTSNAGAWKLLPPGECGPGVTENPMVNPYGVIPFQRFRGEIDPDNGRWWGLSDIRDIIEANHFINTLFSIMDKNAHDQGWSQLVLVNFPDDVTKIAVGTLKAIRTGEGGDAKFIVPDLKVQEFLTLIEKIYTLALNGKSIPQAAVRTFSEPKSGVSLELSLRPLIDLAKNRRRYWMREESELLKMALLVREHHESGRIFTPDKAAEFMATWDVDVAWVEDLMPHDLDKEIARDLELMNAGLKDPKDLVKKYNTLSGIDPEAKMKEIVKNLSLMRQALGLDAQGKPVKETPDGGRERGSRADRG